MKPTPDQHNEASELLFEEDQAGILAQLIGERDEARQIAAKLAKALGYSVEKATPFEVGLLKNGKGIRTWFCQDFDRKLPELDHPIILACIARVEAHPV
jgi:hypothetical protein